MYAKKMHGIRPAVLIRNSSSQLIRYSLDTGVRYSTYFQVSERLQQGPEFSHNYTIGFVIDYIIITS
jgi:hypothetical protein